MSASTHGTPASGYGTGIIRLIRPRTLGPRDLILSLSTHATGVAGGDRLGVGGGPGGVSPYGGATLLAHVSVCHAQQDPGWWYHEAKGKGSIPSAATPIYKYIAELEYVA